MPGPENRGLPEGAFPLTGKFDIENIEQLVPHPPRGVDPDFDRISDEIEEMDRYHAESERLIHIDPDGTKHYR